jgi:ribulose-5-phosphate 4-epimerase/fuculose-1-phosphate aldolase
VLTTAGHAWLPVTMQAAVLGPVGTFGKTASVNSAELGAEVAAFLGGAKAALLRRHGAVTVAASVLDAFVQSVYLEENAQRQYMALQIGEPYVFNDAEREACRKNLWSRALFLKAWDHYRSKLAG